MTNHDVSDPAVSESSAGDASTPTRVETRADERAYRAAIFSFVVATVGGFAAVYGYWSEDSERVLGLGLAVALLGIGFGLVSWSKYLDLPENVVQERHPLRSTVEEREDFHEEVEMTVETVGRRKLLTLLFAGSIGSLALGFLGPIGSLGPRKGSVRGGTSWTAGSRLVTSNGEPIVAADGGFDQLATVFPDGAIGVDDSQVILLRVKPGLFTERTVEGGTADGWVAYSKICTHAGCSVGLFGIDDRPPDVLRQLVCPCHQSVFDPVDAARPVGGPASRSLPQLAIAVDDEGFLVAQSDFDRPVGPISWLQG